MIRLAALLLFGWSLLLADAVPGLYILTMQEASGSAVKADIRAAAADRAVRKINVRQAVEQRQAKVIDSLDRTLDALVIQAPGTTAADWQAVPGVAKVFPVWERKLLLDRVPGIVGASAAWERISRDRAGLGVKIGILDTGIDWEHPGFQDDTLPQLPGYPVGNRESDLAGTNRKIIVARSYENLTSFGASSPRDVIGHGTAVAMCAAGVAHQSPMGEISGIAPKAYLGAYKIFGGTSGTTNDTVILRALDDAVADGMDIVNMSFGSAPEMRPDLDPLVDAVERAAARGVIVVKAAGNEGPDPGSISSTSQTSAVINVGASRNDRTLVSAATVGESDYVALPPGNALPMDPLSGPMSDAAAADQSGLACAAFPANAFTGRIVLILRGDCTFEEKLNNVQGAGALGAIIYTNDQPVNQWDPRAARLPALMVSNASGRRIKQQIAANPEVVAVLRFRPSPFPVDPFAVSSFSSRGPTSANTIGIDLVAVGEDVYTAAQRSTPSGDVFGADGYTLIDGTSFSSPIVAGAAAVAKAERPGLSPIQYKSLLVNTASLLWRNDEVVSVQAAGAGILNLDRALRAIAAAAPTSLSFGAGGGDVALSRDLTVTNVSASPDTFQIGVVALRGVGPEPAIDTVTLQPGESRTFPVRLNRSGLTGEQSGFLVVRGAGSDVDLRVPYWYAVRGSEATSISVIFPVGASARAGRRLRMYLRLNDASGVSLTDAPPDITVEGGFGSVDNVVLDPAHPGTWRVDVTMGTLPGTNTFRIQSGGRATRVLSFNAN
ncbi:MAG: S8 family serine peptidase [Bryobacteraceae bacterium]